MTEGTLTRPWSLRPAESVASLAVDVCGIGAPALSITWLAHGFGGREHELLAASVAVSAATAVVLQAWRSVRVVFGVVAVLAAAAVLVLVVHAPHSAGGREYHTELAGGYVLAALTYLDVRAYVERTGQRAVRALAVATCAAGPLEFAWGFTAWWAGGLGGSPMVGTFYWHNQFATFVSLSGIVGLGLALEGVRPWRALGWIAVATAVAGDVASTSRASLALLLAGIAVVSAYGLARAPHWRTAARLVGLGSVAAALVLAMNNPPLMTSTSSPFAAEQSRTQGQSVSQNGVYRTEFWREAIDVGLRHPFLGAGGGELGTAADGLVPASWPKSPLAHDGFLQAFADGGVVLAVPLVAAAAAAAWLALRTGLQALRRRRISEIQMAVTVAAGVALVHSAIDFDWSYPALFAFGAVVAALAAPRYSARDDA